MPVPLPPCPHPAGVGPFNRAQFPIPAEFQGTVVPMGLDPGTAAGREADGEDLPCAVAVSLERRGRRKGGQGIAGFGKEKAQEVLSHWESGV